MSRPLGITVLGALVLIASLIVGLIGIAGIFVGLAGFLPGVGFNSTALLLGGLLYIVLGTVLGISGFGLLSLRPWAWWLALLTTLFAVVYTMYQVLQKPDDLRPGTLITLVVGAAIFAYLLTVYRSFHRPKPVA
ncbi:MAG: DUF2127 domain-containing protein [Candidatus Thermoplasmatota archaeon]